MNAWALRRKLDKAITDISLNEQFIRNLAAYSSDSECVPMAIQEQGLVSVSAELVRFLNGEGALDDCYFGEKPPGERGNFWWRKHLPKPAVQRERECDENREGAVRREVD